MRLVARTAADPDELIGPVRAVIRGLDPSLAVAEVRTIEDVLAAAVAQPRFMVVLMGAFSAIALLLAMVGIYGVVSYVVSQRTREIGVRMALGAGRARVSRMVVGGALLIAAVGVAAGLVAALALTRLMNTILFGVTATDPATFAVVVLILLGVTAIASYLPARRAASIHPTEALRCE